MRKNGLSAIIGIVLLLYVSGIMSCGGGGTPPTVTTNHSSIVTKSAPIAPGTTCPTGGISIDIGIDDNGNGVLDTDEVDATQNVCNGLISLVSIVSEPSGSNCADGGFKVTSGTDANGNGTLDLGEVALTKYACNGATGPAGPTMPVIQSLATKGVPAAPNGTITANVRAQSAEGLALTYSWSASAGWIIASGGTTTTVTITSPSSRGASGTASVTVTDTQSRTAVGTVALSTVGDGVPVAVAGPDQSVLPGAIVTLDGSASTDLDGDSLTYAWSVISAPPGSAVTTTALSSSTAVDPNFYADKTGAYKLRLVVNDGQANSAADTVTITCRIPVPDTGQTASYTATFGEDSDYTINPMSFTDNGDGTISDNVTGLLWQKCSIGQSGADCLTTSATTTNWYWASGTYDATYNPATIDVCGSLNLVGTGWRLPTDLELMMIMHYGTYSTTINAAYFPATVAQTYLPPYWSSTSFAPNMANAWNAHFSNGNMSHSNKANVSHVRCVR